MRLADSWGEADPDEMILLSRSLYPLDLLDWGVDCDSRADRAEVTSGEAMIRLQIGRRELANWLVEEGSNECGVDSEGCTRGQD